MADDTKRIAAAIAAEIGAKTEQAASAIQLLDEGASVPFIARYRKEATGGLDDTQFRTLAERLVYLRELESRRAAILDSVRSQGKLTDELEAQIGAAATKAELEDLYLPYKPKRRTKAEIARERGLGPLAEAILADRVARPGGSRQALRHRRSRRRQSGAGRARATSSPRRSRSMPIWSAACAPIMQEKAFLRADVDDGKQEAGAKFSDYFDHVERWAKVPSHRALAMLRGRNEGVLSLDIEVDADDASPVEAGRAHDRRGLSGRLRGARATSGCARSSRWTWRVKLSTSLSLDLMTELRERAEEEAIKVFARNLKDLLLAAPAGSRATMGLDPGIRTGVKVAVDRRDRQGPRDDDRLSVPAAQRRQGRAGGARRAHPSPQSRTDRHRQRHGEPRDGAARRRHAGAAAGPEADEGRGQRGGRVGLFGLGAWRRPNFPASTFRLRGAVSIARRLQDPLAELVKIEPKSIGVGQYQHDVDQHRLGRSLEAVVEDAVNAVGVDLNTASAPLLARVSGLGRRWRRRSSRIATPPGRSPAARIC